MLSCLVMPACSCQTVLALAGKCLRVSGKEHDGANVVLTKCDVSDPLQVNSHFYFIFNVLKVERGMQ